MLPQILLAIALYHLIFLAVFALVMSTVDNSLYQKSINDAATYYGLLQRIVIVLTVPYLLPATVWWRFIRANKYAIPEKPKA